MSAALDRLLKATTLEPSLSEAEASELAGELQSLVGMHIYPRSITALQQSILALGKNALSKVLVCISNDGGVCSRIPGTESRVETADGKVTLRVCDASSEAAASLRELLPFLKPKTLGLEKSAGCGDRLGLATVGHVRAVRKSSMSPIFAQQSIRENARTGRNPQEVMDDALWGVFQEGWRDGFGADADHLKNTDDIDSCVKAGFTFYTIDPGEHVDDEANTASIEDLKTKIKALPWNDLETNWNDVLKDLGSKKIDLGSFQHEISEEQLMRATAKYGKVVAHTAKMYRHLEKAMGATPFELEMSVDETETVTTLAEHIFIAHQLKRLGVRWVSLAPRYVGDFEKGVDYIGDLKEFEESFRQHLAVSQTYGPYKLSLHSGSDKFSIYPIAGRVAGDLVHLKTAGTSYLEALRAIGKTNPALFREIARFARERYPIDKATYHVSAKLEKMPDVESLADEKLTDLLNDFHSREILHVTFGSVLHNPAFRDRFFATLRENEEVYNEMIETHFLKHLLPFDEATSRAGV